MKKLFFVFPLLAMLSCSTTHYYIVRHAEKAPAENMMTSDVPLSNEGAQRAEALKMVLRNKNIRHIYSTNYKRTQSTAAPLANALGVTVQTYKPDDTTFFSRIKNGKQNTLIVGHSNTVDNIVNGITGKSHLKDLPETQYGDLFIIKQKGQKITFEQKRFGQ